jgi:phospholipid transport system substrate-binding protein
MIATTRRGLIVAAMAAALVSGPVSAVPADTALTDPLRGLHAALEAAMRSGHSVPFPERFDALAPLVDRAFDLETVLKVSIGMRWDSLDAEMRGRLLKAFRRFTIATYVANFDKYDGEQFEIVPGVREFGSDKIVGTEIASPGSSRIRLDYVMRDEAGVWRAVDVLLDGSISRVAVQRSDFRKILASGDAEALIASLKHKIADLSDGALRS